MTKNYSLYDNSQKSSDADLWLGIYMKPYPIQLKETNRDFISPEISLSSNQ